VEQRKVGRPIFLLPRAGAVLKVFADRFSEVPGGGGLLEGISESARAKTAETLLELLGARVRNPNTRSAYRVAWRSFLKSPGGTMTGVSSTSTLRNFA
jgi:hypothetical protein